MEVGHIVRRVDCAYTSVILRGLKMNFWRARSRIVPSFGIPLILIFSMFFGLGAAHAKPDSAIGDGCVRGVSLEEFRALALERSPLVAEIDSQYSGDVARAYDTEVFKNPEVQFEQVYTGSKINGDNDPQTNASIGLPLKLSNFGAKSRVATLLRQAGDVQRRARLLELVQRLTIQYGNLYLLQRSQELLLEAERRAAKKVALIHQGVKQGLLTAGDHQLFEAEKFRLESQRAGLLASFATLQAELSAMLGTPCQLKALGPISLAALPSDDLLIAKAKESALSESARAELLVRLQVEQSRLARLDAVPEFAPRIVYQHTNDGGDFIGAGISLPLPFFNRNRGAIDKTDAELVAAERRRDAYLAGGIETQVRALRLAAASSAMQADIFKRSVVPSFAGALRSQEDLYAQGKGSVLQVWQTLRVYNDAERELLAVSLGAVNARAQLSILVGEEL
jgi:cobalt-zinc-cadmium efflux system outer membrane protein